MKLNVKTLRGREVGTVIEIAERCDLLKLDDAPDLRDVNLTGEVTLLSDRLLLKGSLESVLTQTCARCLADFDYTLKADYSEEYSRQPVDDQFHYEGDVLDATPMVRTVVLLNLPAIPLHATDCAGLCPTCGKNLNTTPHDHPKNSSNHPFAELEKLKGDGGSGQQKPVN